MNTTISDDRLLRRLPEGGVETRGGHVTLFYRRVYCIRALILIFLALSHSPPSYAESLSDTDIYNDYQSQYRELQEQIRTFRAAGLHKKTAVEPGKILSSHAQIIATDTDPLDVVLRQPQRVRVLVAGSGKSLCQR